MDDVDDDDNEDSDEDEDADPDDDDNEYAMEVNEEVIIHSIFSNPIPKK